MTYILVVLVLFGADERYVAVAHGLSWAQCERMADDYTNAVCVRGES